MAPGEQYPHQPVITELRLTAFKSFRDAVLRFQPITILIGKNGAGKSNVLDGLEVLSRLALGETLPDALDSRRREGGPIRGGSRGCAPHGSDYFALGCTVDFDGVLYLYDIEVQIKPTLEVRSEIFSIQRGEKRDVLYHSAEHEERDPRRPYLTKLTDVVDDDLELALDFIAPISALRDIFHLDPYPSDMRNYVAETDHKLRRGADNISPVLFALRERDEKRFGKIQDQVQAIAASKVIGLDFLKAEGGEVMLALLEKGCGDPGDIEKTPASQMSDGMLRYAAIVTSLLADRAGLDAVTNSNKLETIEGVQLVIEELENGLHPSQAKKLLELVRTSNETNAVRVLLTTHSPALLDAVEGTLNSSVIVCYYDEDAGYSKLIPLMEMSDYPTVMAQGSLGSVVTEGKFSAARSDNSDYSEFYEFLGL